MVTPGSYCRGKKGPIGPAITGVSYILIGAICGVIGGAIFGFNLDGDVDFFGFIGASIGIGAIVGNGFGNHEKAELVH